MAPGRRRRGEAANGSEAISARKCHGRRVWSGPDRVHVQIRKLWSKDETATSGASARDLEETLEAIAGVEWARVNALLGRVVISRDRHTCSDSTLVLAVLAAEARMALDRRPLADSSYPGDPQALYRVFAEFVAEAAAFGVGQGVRVLLHRRRPLSVEIDLAALVALAESTPAIRRRLVRVVGRSGTELGLELINAILHFIRQSDLGPAAGIMKHALALRELRSRRATWERREPELCARAGAHSRAAPAVPPRPRPLRAGPIERYSDRAIPVALGATAFSYASVHTLGGALSPLFAGLPGPAHLGREAFAAHLGHLLARRGTVVFDRSVLRLLDRLDCAVIDGDVLSRDKALAGELFASADKAGLEIVFVGGDPDALDATETPRRHERERDAADVIRAIQSEDRGVCFIGPGPPAAHLTADVGIGTPHDGDAPAWGANIITEAGLGDARLILEAVAAARRTADQSVQLALVEAAASVGLAFSGLKLKTTSRIMQATSAASIMSMANGVRIAHELTRVRDPGPPDEQPPWHELGAREVVSRLRTRAAGLTAAEAEARYVPPRPPPSASATFARMVGEELRSPLAPVLAVGAGLSALVGSVADAALIGSVVLINAGVGGGQRYRAERAVAALRRRERRKVVVLRPGGSESVDAARLVPGDVIELRSGDVVPADARLLDAEAFEVNEAPLTGESAPVAKTPAPVTAAAIADRASMIYEGTSVAAGRAAAVVVAVGAATEVRRASAGDSDRAPPRGVERRLDALARLTAPVALGSGLAITASGLLRRRPAAEIVSSGVGLAVAAVPEGLTVLATLSQLAAARRLSEVGALVRDPRAVEALGRVDVLCADKTGTLTEGKIRLSHVSDGARGARADDLDDALEHVLAVARRASPERAPGERLPHLTDQALVDGARRAGVRARHGLGSWQRLDALPFEPSRGYFASLGAHPGGAIISVKGAPEVVLPACSERRIGGRRVPLDDDTRRELVREGMRLARRGLRVLAVAERVAPKIETIAAEHVEGLSFCGFVGLSDPVHPSAREAMSRVRKAGVRPIMLTGDHPSTANAIAAELGLLDENGVTTGPELDEMSDAELSAKLPEISVCARTSPAHKVRIIRALQTAGRVVAMTGDGANDSPAIQLADAGVAIGEHAASAAREAADLVVTDGRIETIVDAILEGRALWPAVRDAVSVLVGGNLGEIGFSLAGGIARGSSPLNARQLLLVNLITDTLPALALALRPPRRKDAEELLREGPDVSLGRMLTRDLVWRGSVTAAAAGAGYAVSRLTGATRARASTVSLVALTGAQLGQTLVSGWESRAVVATGLGSLAVLLAVVQTPIVSRAFGCRPLGPVGLAQAGGSTVVATAASAVIPPLTERASRLVAKWRQREP